MCWVRGMDRGNVKNRPGETKGLEEGKKKREAGKVWGRDLLIETTSCASKPCIDDY